MPTCNNYEILKSLSSSLDRLEEAAWHIRMMESRYHFADQFRWSLNSFLRTLKEILQLLTMEVQNNSDVSAWLSQQKAILKEDPLISYLYKQRDHVVHKSMLRPGSKGMVGFTRGRGLKLGIGMPIDPMEDSEIAIKRYIYNSVKNSDFLGILYSEDDGGGEYTCVQREWRLSEFGDIEAIELVAKAWEKVASVTMDTAEKLGASVIEPSFEIQNPNRVQFEIYEPSWIKEQLQEAREHLESAEET